MKKHRIIYSLILLGASQSAWASPISYEELLANALNSSAVVTEIELRIAERRAEAIDTGKLDNPEVSAEVRPSVRNGVDGDTEYEVGITQPLKPSSFGQRQRVAKLMDNAASLEKRLALHELTQSLKLAYGKSWALQEKLHLTKEIEKKARGLLANLKKSEDTGLLPDSVIKLVRAETKKIAAESEGASADLEKSLAELTRLANKSLKDKTLEPLKLRDASPNIGNHTESNMPLLERLKLRRKIATEQLKLARLDSTPGFAPSVAFEHTSDGDDRIIAGITFELPFWDRNKSAQLISTANASARDAEWMYYSGETFSDEISQLVKFARSSAKQAVLYSNDVLPTLREALADAEKEYTAGQGNAVQIWQTLNQLSDAQDRYLEVWMNALSAQTELSILMGKEF